ncbi:FAD-dependent oxidoreductase [Streptomyces sp. NPDC006326]|uniref:FAD-dependent oxidoreductase n=1 Tax=Streptomyces sp. NPDC006326 TaxID=3156752 RepID=UPI0033AAC727
MDNASTQQFDVVVVGGGAAGLAGALTLARARRSVLVLDSGSPRNAPAAHLHGYLGRDGESPAELLAGGRKEVTGYGGAIRSGAAGTAVAADPQPGGGFLVRCADGAAVRAGRLLLATGLEDRLPELPGLRERWGREVLHCPYCHGWEVGGMPLAVLASGPVAVHQAQLWRQWSDRVTLLAHTWTPTAADRELLAALGIAVVEGEVTGLVVTGEGDLEADGGGEDGGGRSGGGGRLVGVRLAGGGSVDCAALVVAPWFGARAGVAASLGLPVTTLERDGVAVGTCVEADPVTGATALPGVWAAGNLVNPVDQLSGAAAAGVRAAVAINTDLIEAETRRALAAYRAGRSGT